MMVGKTLVIGPALLALAAVASVVDRNTYGPLFVQRPAYANVAVLPKPMQKSDALVPDNALHGEQRHLGRARDGLFYVKAQVNGVPVRFVLDTGATLVVLTREDAKRIGIVRKAEGGLDSMETASGVSSIERVTIDQIRVAGHSVDDVDAAVAERGLKTSLLGQNLLSQLGPITLSADAADLN